MGINIMATKGPTFLYGNTNGSLGRGEITEHIGYKYAKDYNKHKLFVDFIKHGSDFGVGSKEDYAAHAIHFANFVDRKNCISFIDKVRTTHKYNVSTNTYVAVDKKGYVITYFKPKEGKKYYMNKKKEKNNE